ncbi:unnamed protein product [Miscanthus lutarioriparius]|uniref:Uncharacterized protein n=1 Tax=Miscanthus lutarioriparius TaxID=422564 RepID=A0A811NWT2_9POAL|nr:unnamed protein product [Miscanthus lutarioriparius]
MESSCADHGQPKKETTGASQDSNNKSGKSRADLYAGAVAQRVLYGTSRCRGGSPRKPAAVSVAGSGKPPSRLSKMSGSAEAT